MSERLYLEGAFDGQTFGPLPNAYLSGSFVGCTFESIGGEGSPGVDAYRADFTDAMFPATIADFVDRECTYAGAVLPETPSFHTYDMTVEILRRAWAALSGAEQRPRRQIADFLIPAVEEYGSGGFLGVGLECLMRFGDARCDDFSAAVFPPWMRAHFALVKRWWRDRGHTWPA